jgi:hypothetical protein
MREIECVANEPETRRRWFHDDYFDLFVWQGPSGEILRFQLCYGTSSSGLALVWDKQHGYFHDGAKTGAPGAGGAIGTGAAPGKPPASDPVLLRFIAMVGSLPDDIHLFVAIRIREYVDKMSAIPTRRKHFRRAIWQLKPPET